MRIYFIKAAEHGAVIDVATADSAKRAMIHYLDALHQYDRAWVSDGSGNDIAIDHLAQLANEESGSV